MTLLVQNTVFLVVFYLDIAAVDNSEIVIHSQLAIGYKLY
jgi:hypothetical protein